MNSQCNPRLSHKSISMESFNLLHCVLSGNRCRRRGARQPDVGLWGAGGCVARSSVYRCVPASLAWSKGICRMVRRTSGFAPLLFPRPEPTDGLHILIKPHRVLLLVCNQPCLNLAALGYAPSSSDKIATCRLGHDDNVLPGSWKEKKPREFKPPDIVQSVWSAHHGNN
jgi:hypothetical protein